MTPSTSVPERVPHTNSIAEYQSLRVIHAIAKVYRSNNSHVRQITRDICHIVAAYRLHDKEAALACNHYIVTKYPTIYESAVRYGLRRMSEQEMLHRTEPQLQHMLYTLCLFLYDTLKMRHILELK